MIDEIYKPPSARLTEDDQTEARLSDGSLEGALRGDYEFGIGEI